MTDDTRMDLVRKFERVTHVPGAGFSLSVWAGREGWADSSQDFRERSGQRALTELDAMIDQLTDVRARLAAEVTDQDTEPAREGPSVFFRDAFSRTASAEFRVDNTGLVHVVVKARQELPAGTWENFRVESAVTSQQFAEAAELVAREVPA